MAYNFIREEGGRGYTGRKHNLNCQAASAKKEQLQLRARTQARGGPRLQERRFLS